MIDWTGTKWTPAAAASGPSERRFTAPAVNNPVDDPDRMTRPACRSAPLFLAAGCARTFRWYFKLSTGFTAFMSARRWAAKPLRPRSAGRRWCGAIRWRCCRSVATTWAIISSTGSAWGRASPSRRDFPRQLVPPRRPRQISLARLRRNMRVLKWIVDRCTAGLRSGKSDRLDAARRGFRLARPRIRPRNVLRPHGGQPGCGRRGGASFTRSCSISFFHRLPKEFIYERELLRSRLCRPA